MLKEWNKTNRTEHQTKADAILFVRSFVMEKRLSVLLVACGVCSAMQKIMNQRCYEKMLATTREFYSKTSK